VCIDTGLVEVILQIKSESILAEIELDNCDELDRQSFSVLNNLCLLEPLERDETVG
jgi:Fe-S cluster assembly iron-binding protein IscA